MALKLNKQREQRAGFVAATQHLIIDEILAVYKVSDATSSACSVIYRGKP
jgi:hypothetical protein